MKQSTFSAVMANSIKNLLQGYTKGIRFVAVLTVLLTMGFGQAWGAEGDLVYALSFSKLTTGTNFNSYTAAHTITVSSKNWNVMGNQSIGAYLCIGGKNTSNTNRTLYSTSQISSDKVVGKITISNGGTGGTGTITLNSIKLEVASNSTFTTIIDTKTINSPAKDGSIDFTPTAPLAVWPKNSYYRITYNYKNSQSSSNGYIKVNNIKFYEGSDPDTNFKVGATLFIQALSSSAWNDGACVKAWFNGNSPAATTYWLYDATGSDAGKKMFATIVPSGTSSKVQIQRFASNCSDWWNSNGDLNKSDGAETNILQTYGASENNVAWNAGGLQLYLYGTPNSWASSLATFSDKGNGVWTATYSNYSPTNTSADFKIKDNYNGWIGNTGSNDNATLSEMVVGSTYDITATLDIKDHSLTLSKELKKCQVHFDMNGHGTAIESKTNVTPNSTITAPTAPTDTDYKFEGWFKDANCTTAWNFSTDKVTETMTLYAKWTKKVTYTITWKVNKQTYTAGTPTTTIYEGSTYKNLTLPTAPLDNTLGECYDDKKFVGWSTTNIGSTESAAPSVLFKTAADAPNTAITDNTTFYAVFATENGGGTSTVSVFFEDFSTITDGNSTSTSGSSSTWTKNSNFNSVYSAYQAGGAVRLGKSNEAGNLVTKQLTAAIGETLTISFKVKGWSSVEGQIQVSGNNSEFTQPSAISYSSTMSGSFETKSVSVVLTKANPYIKIATTAKRAFIDDIQITKTTTSAPTYSNYVTECCTLNNITLDGSGTTTGGTFSATVTKACKGEEITLTATAAECYEFVSWTIKKTSDGTDVTNSVLNGNTLTMPDYAVTVYATFKSLSVTEIALSMTGGHKNLDVGDTNQLLVTYTPADATCDKAIVSWTSSDDNVISVTNSGLVTALRSGNATITATTAAGVSNTYTIVVNNPACEAWYLHYWNASTGGDECFYKMKPDDPNDHEWRTGNFSLPSNSDEDGFVVNNAKGEDPYKTDQIFRTGIGFADIQRGGLNCGTNLYPGQDAYGQLSIYDDSETPNRYIAFYPAQYMVTFGKERETWVELPLTNTTGYEYESEPFTVPNGYKIDASYKYWVGITKRDGTIHYVDGKSSTDAMNGVNGLSADDMAGKSGVWHIYSNSCANNWYCEFIHYYRVDFNLNGGEGDFAPRYGKATEPYVKFTTTDIGAPTRTGYTFLGWKDQNNKIYAPTGATVTIKEDLTLTALWIEEYPSTNCRWEEVTIDDIEYGDEVVIAMAWGEIIYALPNNGGANRPDAIDIDVISLSSNRVDETLIWNIDKDNNNQLTIYPNGVTNKWLYCTSSYVAVGNNVNNKFIIENGFLKHIVQSKYLAIALQAAEKYWHYYASNSTNLTSQTLKFYKKVCLPEGQYRVTWDANGGQWSDGSTTKEEIYAEGATINKPDNPTREGYMFAGWYKEPECVNAWNFDTDDVDDNITLYAKWLEIYTITWMVNGTIFTTTEVTEGEQITQPNPSPDLRDYCGQVFAGWTDAEMAETSVAAPTLYPTPNQFPQANADVTFYAVFADYKD